MGDGRALGEARTAMEPIKKQSNAVGGSSIQKRHKRVRATLRPIYAIFGIRFLSFTLIELIPHLITFLFKVIGVSQKKGS